MYMYLVCIYISVYSQLSISVYSGTDLSVSFTKLYNSSFLLLFPPAQTTPKKDFFASKKTDKKQRSLTFHSDHFSNFSDFHLL